MELLLHKANDDKKFDTRVVEKNINRGVTTLKEHEAYLSSLPDDSNACETVSLDQVLNQN